MTVIIVFLIEWGIKLNKDLVNNIIECVDKSFNYKVKNTDYFVTAFTHKSISQTNNYERLEILGDAVLQLFITEMLFTKYPHISEGDITVMRQNLVNTECLEKVYLSLDLKTIIEKININLDGSRISSDILESVLGAIYLDSNDLTVKDIINTIFQPLVSESLLKKDSKSQLQEYLHSKKIPLPTYTSSKSSKKSFKYLVACKIPQMNIDVQMHSNKIKSTEQLLAQTILNKINGKS